jgi:succinyl-diaminopimelate desuccinylase
MLNPLSLTKALCDISSESGNEDDIAKWVFDFLDGLKYLEVVRVGNAIVAKTDLGLKKRVILAGHLDTVPISTKTSNFPSQFRDVTDSTVDNDEQAKFLWGRGTVDMKAGDGVFLALAQHFSDNSDNLKYDITFIFYDNEEVAADLNGLGKLARTNPELIQGDFAILGEPTNCLVEAGCNGTLRFDVVLEGVAAHSARSWVGENAIHKAAPVLQILNSCNAQSIEDRTVNVDGLGYIEGLNATLINGGTATNVIPDEVRVHINFRFAPDKSLDEAKQLMLDLFNEFDVQFKDESPAARPGTNLPEVQEFAALVKEKTGEEVRPKYGWTDVARFSQLGIPALNFAPGDPLLCHTDNEQVELSEIEQAFEVLVQYFTV